MKTSIYSLVFISFLQACGSNETPEATHEETTTTTAVTLTPEQMKLAGITVGKMPKMLIDSTLRAVGSIELAPTQRVSVHSTVTGYVRKTNIQVGTRVSKGDVICVLEHPSYIEKQRELLETKSKLPFLESELARKKELKDNEVGSTKNYQAAQSEYDWAKAHYAGLRAELQLLGFDVPKIETENQYQSQLVITASASGVVSQCFINQGKLVQPETPLCEIADVSRPYAELRVFAQHLPQVHEGSTITVRLAGSDQTYAATVRSIVPWVDEQTKTAIVRAEFQRPDAALVAGSAIQADLQMHQQLQTALPKECVLEQEGKFFAYSIDAQQIVQLVPVQVTGQKGEWLGIAGDTSRQYVLQGGYYLKDKF